MHVGVVTNVIIILDSLFQFLDYSKINVTFLYELIFFLILGSNTSNLIYILYTERLNHMNILLCTCNIT